MRNTLLAATLFSMFTLQPALAGEGEWQITARGGRGDLDIEPPFRGVNAPRGDANTYGIGVGFGYLTPIGIVAEIGGDLGAEFDLFGALDNYSITQTFAAVGYQFELGEGWRFVPKVGRTRWSLRSDEGMLFNPGPEQRDEVSGYDYYWEASLSRRISRAVALGIHYKRGDYTFGIARSTTFLVTIGL